MGPPECSRYEVTLALIKQRGCSAGWSGCAGSGLAALTPSSMDGMIVVASTTLLTDSRGGDRGGYLPRAVLVGECGEPGRECRAVAEPTVTGRVIAADRRSRITYADGSSREFIALA